LLPAFLFFLAVWVGINAFSARYELKGLPADQRPATRDVVIIAKRLCFDSKFIIPE